MCISQSACQSVCQSQSIFWVNIISVCRKLKLKHLYKTCSASSFLTSSVSHRNRHKDNQSSNSLTGQLFITCIKRICQHACSLSSELLKKLHRNIVSLLTDTKLELVLIYQPRMDDWVSTRCSGIDGYQQKLNDHRPVIR